MDVATQLYKLSPALAQISRLCDELWWMVGNCAIYLTETPNDKDLRATLERLFLVPKDATYKSSWTHFRELYKLLDDPRLDIVGYREHATTFQESIIVFACPDSPEECQEAAVSLVLCHDHYYKWLRLERDASFGYWGRCFLEYLDETETIDKLEFFARHFNGPDKLDADSTTSTANSFLATGCSTHHLVIDIPKYRVLFRDCWECDLGNTKMFHLLRVLAEKPEQYLPYSRITQLMGDHSLYTSQLKVCKSRLCSRLRDYDCKDIADAIESQKGAYGLFLSEIGITLTLIRNETEMQP